MAKPRFAVSHTISGSCVMRLYNVTAAASLDITLSEGVLWTDPIYGTELATTATAPCLLGRIAKALTDSSGDLQTYSKSYGGWTSASYLGGVSVPTFSTVSGTPSIRWQMGDSVCTAAGRRVAERLGIDQISNDPSAGATSISGRIVQGAWTSDRGESGDIDTMQNAYGITNQAYDGTLYTTDIGDALHERVVSLSGVPAAYARSRNNLAVATLAAYDYSFETHIYKWARRGERIRYYADGSTTAATWLSAALAKTSNAVSIAADISLANGDTLWVDGEKMHIVSGAGTTSLVVYRENPVAHVAYAPVSSSFVGTFALANSNGNVNRQGYRPSRRAADDDRWDLDIALVQGKMP